ncbi:MAG: hypothetical protein JW959_00630 [Pirellulales bacterium]|nr:hypothetical protein [Pirellulales bacterium]
MRDLDPPYGYLNDHHLLFSQPKKVIDALIESMSQRERERAEGDSPIFAVNRENRGSPR